MSDLLLEAKGVEQAFDYPLFSGVDFSLCACESKAVVGRSGSGKSTLLHICSTFLKPDAGSVEVFGYDIYGNDAHQIDRLRRFDLGIVFQSHYLFKGMSARENIESACMLAKTTIDDWLLEALEIADVIDQKVGSLSGGQQQRVSIARVLVKKPRIIFADEPTGNLDDETASLVMDVFLEYLRKEEAALMLVTHDKTLAKRCDHIFRLENNCLVQEPS